MSVLTSTTAPTGAVNFAASLTEDELQDRFLMLLVTSLKNPDSLNPMDNTAMTTQMAQLTAPGSEMRW